ncbi:MAG: glycosyltransferase [Oscillospiraceae bacterium]|nr:glycosyltransferase [Oscillospiraceae bacterium]
MSGLDLSASQYISFVDSDDIVDRHYLAFLYDTLQKSNADIAGFRFERFCDSELRPVQSSI